MHRALRLLLSAAPPRSCLPHAASLRARALGSCSGLVLRARFAPSLSLLRPLWEAFASHPGVSCANPAVAAAARDQPCHTELAVAWCARRVRLVAVQLQ